ncbi:NUDIX domain-containing protein [bacterium]|jgi:8-oxo-dGTP diphosphatase|nr:NUDIX domain-containing protein [Sphingobacteriia bacterium]NCC71171.1 NUDIX domain-containing protein [bacterium]
MRKSSGALITYDKKVLMLLRDNNPGIPDPNCWQLIGGYLEENETPIEALIREVREESNLRISEYEAIEIGKFIIPEKLEYFFYWVKLSEDKLKDIKLGNEGQKVGFFSVEELSEMKLGEIVSVYFQKFKDGLKNIVENEIIDKGLLGFDENGLYVIK